MQAKEHQQTGIRVFFGLLVLPCLHLAGITLNQAGNTNNGVKLGFMGHEPWGVIIVSSAEWKKPG
jgi:hypothetical protein